MKRLDDEARAELLTFLVVGQLFAFVFVLDGEKLIEGNGDSAHDVVVLGFHRLSNQIAIAFDVSAATADY
ncbi:hypothetical protein [Paraburkholderia unamae]|uniref:Uncharacterized protein n=1 Tax=Paraburkholderia unamae TaxID=219649 RepID=A0ABX5KKN9_9BURK|nr:hypothetical protein [Paraburkholderia unamae]PVX82424.1 hypothetical protein C7402_109278 [Paraburkholderia unamae]